MLLDYKNFKFKRKEINWFKLILKLYDFKCSLLLMLQYIYDKSEKKANCSNIVA